jgi:hypothetical protein
MAAVQPEPWLGALITNNNNLNNEAAWGRVRLLRQRLKVSKK